MQRLSVLFLLGVVAFGIPATAAESVLAHYRGMTLGEPLQAVVDRLQLTPADVKTVHAQPALVQQVTWRPRPFNSGVTPTVESIAEMLLTFHAGQLAQIAVTYERTRTQGLTDADLREALEGSYGPSLLISTPTQRAAGIPSPEMAIGRWEDSETVLILWREQFPNRIGLTLTSIARAAALQAAIADGVRVEAEAAPARELARRAAEAAAIRERDEKIRLENKTKFKP
jgi:hypothetical protein